MNLFNPPINENFDGAKVGLPGRVFRRVHDTDLDETSKMSVFGCEQCAFDQDGELSSFGSCAYFTCSPVNETWTHYEEVK